ncbi:4011_t:CDS:2 [Ambispora gerdemannii]|uniref:4011_t:CDS:1 n=1 Tax=Ambispora gerdemannii TaxID=144530 RepID=A0A9N9F9Z9_9GLOM|nr:4011_t:CDS:2 [Ambispora gerdemannii]
MPVEERARLRRAACDGNLLLIKRLMLKTSIQNPDPDNGWTTLMYAARCGHAHVVEFLLNAGHEDHEISKDFENNTVLMIASQYNHLEIMKIYTNFFPDCIHIRNKKGQTALIFAAQRGYIDVMKWLFANGADINQTDYDGNTALHYAAAWNRFEAVTLLIERGIIFAGKNIAGWTALDYSYSVEIESHIQERARAQFEESRISRRRNNLKVNVDSIIGIEMVAPPLATRSATFPPQQQQRPSLEYETRSASFSNTPRPSGEYESVYGNSLHSSGTLSPNEIASPVRRKESLPW